MFPPDGAGQSVAVVHSKLVKDKVSVVRLPQQT
jgi:hypothetical protein